MRSQRALFILVLAAFFAGPLTPPGFASGATAIRAPLPPELPFGGESRSLIAPADDPWITPAEATGLTGTPSYGETIAYLERLVAAAPELAMVSVGRTAQGREIPMIIADASGADTPEKLRATGKPILLAHAGIHAGEIDGKDAGLMLLRDLTVRGTKRQLLDGASFLFIPILNADGHERSSPFGRMNQRGPTEMGWRTNSLNLNLNRDFTKLDTREVRALLAVFQAWQPHLYLDLHVTDGADYQYDITFGYNGAHAFSPAIARWLDGHLRPEAESHLRAWGHVPGPLVFLADPSDPGQGNVFWTSSPRFSTGYGDLIHLPSVLVENHSLKPYEQRVLGTYLFLEAALTTLARHGGELVSAIAADRERREEMIPLAWRVGGGGSGGRVGAFLGVTAGGEAAAEPPPPPTTFEYLGVKSKSVPSAISGGQYPVWTGETITLTIPLLAMNEPAITVERPRAYWVPAGWDEVIDRLAAHGIRMERISTARTLEVEMLRLTEAQVDPTPFEGRVRVGAVPVAEKRTETFPPGSVRILTDQPLGDLVAALLEPASPDSFFQWGFFLSVLQRTEYGEDYVLAPLAEAMLAADPALATEFERALAADPELAGDPRARLAWFYERTPYWDDRWLLYPVGREIAARTP